MTYSSTTFLKEPRRTELDVTSHTNSKLPDNQVFSTTILSFLWVLSAISSAAKTEINTSGSGVTIVFTMQDIFLFIFATWLLYQGFQTGNLVLILPWVLVNVYSVYFGHYKSILKMITLLQQLKMRSAPPMLALGLIGFALVLRAALVARILQFSANVWYKYRLEREIFQTI